MILRKSLNLLFVGLGFLSLALGVIGIFVPLLPTVPFLLLSAFCFSKGSPRLHAWLLAQPRIGPMIREWQAHGVIRTRVKILATGTMLVLLSYPMIFKPIATEIKAVVAAICLSVLAFIWTRPSSS